jgi:TRAP-type C4-dicarboxylate transport system permease small subunit
MRLVRWFVQRIAQLAQHFGAVLFLLLFGVFIVQIVARFVFDQPLPWSDEAAVILYVWIILWASAVMVPAREHVVFDLVWNAAGPRLKQVMKVAGHLLIGTLSAMAIPASWDYVQFMARERTPVLDWPLQWVYAPFVLLLVALTLRSAWGLWQVMLGRETAPQEDRS